jgi:hypothetical protein
MITNTTRRFWYALLSSIAFLVRYRYFKKWFWVIALILGIGFTIPQKMIIPVSGATTKSWAADSFWAYPWGTSITHKGIDIFAERGTDVISSTYGMVVYAHLDTYDAFAFQPVKPGSVLGTVGDTGNAKGKPPHLHYAITSPFPFPQLYDSESVQGWKKMFHLCPDTWLR